MATQSGLDGRNRSCIFGNQQQIDECPKLFFVNGKIFYALKQWDYLLRDNEFVLQTDHKNLVYINYEGTPKVKRWKKNYYKSFVF